MDFSNDNLDKENEDVEGKIDIEVTQGNGSELEISPVFEHLNGAKPKIEEKTNKKKIIIPKDDSNK